MKWLEIYLIPLIQSNKSYFTAGVHATLTEWKMHIPNFWIISEENKFRKFKGVQCPMRVFVAYIMRWSVSGYWQLWDFAPDQFYAPQLLDWPHHSQHNRHIDTFVTLCCERSREANHITRYQKIFDKLATGENCRLPDKWNQFLFEEVRTFAVSRDWELYLHRIISLEYGTRKKYYWFNRMRLHSGN